MINDRLATVLSHIETDGVTPDDLRWLLRSGEAAELLCAACGTYSWDHPISRAVGRYLFKVFEQGAQEHTPTE